MFVDPAKEFDRYLSVIPEAKIASNGEFPLCMILQRAVYLRTIWEMAQGQVQRVRVGY